MLWRREEKSIPAALITKNLPTWLSAMGGSILISLPTVVTFVVLAILEDNNPALSSVFYFDIPYYEGTRFEYLFDESYLSTYTIALAAGIFLFAIGSAFIAYIFSSFLYAIAYKQSVARNEIEEEYMLRQNKLIVSFMRR